MKIAVIGFGVEGKAAVDYLRKRGGATITVCDARQKEILPAYKGVAFKFGPNYLTNLDQFDLIIRSPGVPYSKQEFAPVHSKLTSVTKYFFEKCPCPIVGVTGTKGKGTTVSLLYEMLKIGNKRVYLGGNIGRPPLEFLDELEPDDLVLLELSSFQLQDLEKSPHMSIVLGITPDHMDHHASFEEYAAAKKNIVRFQQKNDVAILDFDNQITREFATFTKARVYGITLGGTISRGGFVKAGSLILKMGRAGIFVGERGRAGLIGDHNIKNILAASTAAYLLGVPMEVITSVIKGYKGLPHRLEFIAEKRGVRYYNDSASTNPETAIAAVRSFVTPTILIVGGSDKNLDFSQLGKEIAARLNIKSVVLMGQTKERISQAIEAEVARVEYALAGDGASGLLRRRDSPLELISAENYQEAFMVAQVLAHPGDTVLLSPGCASFDMFDNYMQRGEIFKRFVLDLIS